jgi:hypothetical protein
VICVDVLSLHMNGGLFVSETGMGWDLATRWLRRRHVEMSYDIMSRKWEDRTRRWSGSTWFLLSYYIHRNMNHIN